MTSRERGVMIPGSSGDTAADHSPRSWWRGRSLHLNHLRHHFTSFPPERLSRPWLCPRLFLLPPLSFSLPPALLRRPLFLLVFANAIPRNEPAWAESCPPIIILTGFNLNNAACGFHRYARARLIISRTNSPTRYPSMGIPTPLHRPPLYFSLFPLSFHRPFSPSAPVVLHDQSSPGFGFLRASLTVLQASSRPSWSLRFQNLSLLLLFALRRCCCYCSHFRPVRLVGNRFALYAR